MSANDRYKAASRVVRHHGNSVEVDDIDTDTNVSSSTASGLADNVVGPSSDDLQHWPDDMSLTERDADNTQEDGATRGTLNPVRWYITRSEGIHVSSQLMTASGTLGQPIARLERKDFWKEPTGQISGWNIYDGNGVAVGATNGTTNVDVDPTGTQA